jgi:agmatine/peptidylarginine deiminase
VTQAREIWRFPAEWEAQAAVVIAWPHAGTDWQTNLADVEQSYIAMARSICAHAKLVCLVKSTSLQARAARLIDREPVHFVRYDYDDTWLRDTGPITLQSGDAFRWLNFNFTGWGGKFGASKDDGIVRALHQDAAFAGNSYQSFDFALEGGAIESDGAGTVLSTWNCLSKRHPGKSQAQIEKILCAALAAKRVLWLEHGELDGDDTDAHIDTLARFANAHTIVYQSCDDPKDPHFGPLQAMAAEIHALRQLNGDKYACIALPWAGNIAADDGRRLAASYANFLILNRAVLMPAYGIETDLAAAAVLASVFPRAEIIAVPARSFIAQNGSVHCLTMQIPQGALRE